MAVFQQKVNYWYETSIVGKKPHYSFEFQPLPKAYLHSNFSNQQAVSGSSEFITIFSLIMAFILLVTVINYINLTVARAFKRVKDTGIRKVLGANTKNIVAQFLAETSILFGMCFLVSLFLYYIFRSVIEQLIGHPLQLSIYNNVGVFLFSLE